jgi:integrase
VVYLVYSPPVLAHFGTDQTTGDTMTEKAKQTRSAKGAGRLYKRDANGKEWPAENKTPGNYWLAYSIHGKRIRQRLTDEVGRPITDLRKAKAAQLKVVAPMLAADKGAQLKVVQDAIEQTERAAAVEIKVGQIWNACASDHRTKRRSSGGGCSARTLSGYQSQVEALEKWLKKNHPEAVSMADVTARHAEAYTNHLTEKNVSPSTFNQHLKTLAFTWRALAHKAGLTCNPFQWDSRTLSGIAPRSVESERNLRRKEPLTLEQVNAVMKAAAATDEAGKPLFCGEYFTLLAILLCTGQRLTDCVNLKWKQIDLARSFIKVTPAKTRRYGKELFVPLLPELKEALEKKIRTSDYVLPELAALYQHDNATLAKILRKIFDKAEIQAERDIGTKTARAVANTGAHSFRHAFVTLARLHGINDSVIAQITGHSTLKQMDNYSHLKPADIAAIAAAITPRNLLTEPAKAKTTDQPAAIVPDWIKEKLKTMTAKNWKQIKAELIGEK